MPYPPSSYHTIKRMSSSVSFLSTPQGKVVLSLGIAAVVIPALLAPNPARDGLPWLQDMVTHGGLMRRNIKELGKWPQRVRDAHSTFRHLPLNLQTPRQVREQSQYVRMMSRPHPNFTDLVFSCLIRCRVMEQACTHFGFACYGALTYAGSPRLPVGFFDK